MGSRLPLSNDEIIELYTISDQLVEYVRDLHASARGRIGLDSAPHPKPEPIGDTYPHRRRL